MCPATRLEQLARHADWAWRRRKIFDALQRIAAPATRLDRFAGCGGHLTLARRGDELALSCFACGDRACEACQRKRRAQLQDRVQIALEEAKGSARFFTFTLRHNRAALRDTIARLRHCLRLLHQRPWWRKISRAGVDVIELKLSKDRGAWHVHAHCIVVGSFVDQRELSAVWLGITGDSSIVDVRAIDSCEHAARYVTKYATKPIGEDVLLTPDRLDEALLALKGARMISTWGEWRELIKDDEEPAPRLDPIGTIGDLITASLEGDAGARLYLQMAICRWPKLEHLIPTAAVSALGPAPPGAQSSPAPPDDWRSTQAEQLPF